MQVSFQTAARSSLLRLYHYFMHTHANLHKWTLLLFCRHASVISDGSRIFTAETIQLLYAYIQISGRCPYFAGTIQLLYAYTWALYVHLNKWTLLLFCRHASVISDGSRIFTAETIQLLSSFSEVANKQPDPDLYRHMESLRGTYVYIHIYIYTHTHKYTYTFYIAHISRRFNYFLHFLKWQTNNRSMCLHMYIL